MLPLRRHPELATLLAMADKPREVGAAFKIDDCYGDIAGFFQVIIDPAEQTALADALTRHGPLICQLSAQGIPQAHVYFTFDHDRPGAAEYARWLEEAMAQAIRSPQVEERLAELASFVTMEGGYLRERMATDERFRQHFRTQAWPAAVRVTDCTRKPEGECDTAFEFLAGERRVWDLLLQDQGEQFLDRWGLLAVEILVGDENGLPFPEELVPVAKGAMWRGNNAMLGPLLRFQAEPLFRQAIARPDLTEELRMRVLADLEKHCPDPDQPCIGLNALLTKYVSLSPSALKEDLAPEPSGAQTWIPFYQTYYTAKKVVQGRDVDAADLAFVAIDVVTLFTLGTAAGGKTLAQQGTKSLLKSAGETAAKKAGKKFGKSPQRGIDIIDHIPRNRGAIIASGKQFFQPLIQLSGKIGKKIDQITNIDISEPIRWIFQKTGVGRESMKKWTGLDARVFMRKDRRVVMRVNDKAGPLGKFLRKTAEGAAPDLALEGAREAAETAIKTSAAASTLVQGAVESAWQQNASGLWLAHAAGVL